MLLICSGLHSSVVRTSYYEDRTSRGKKKLVLKIELFLSTRKLEACCDLPTVQASAQYLNGFLEFQTRWVIAPWLHPRTEKTLFSEERLRSAPQKGIRMHSVHTWQPIQNRSEWKVAVRLIIRWWKSESVENDDEWMIQGDAIKHSNPPYSGPLVQLNQLYRLTECQECSESKFHSSLQADRCW